MFAIERKQTVQICEKLMDAISEAFLIIELKAQY
jgi:hypothetical protein